MKTQGSTGCDKTIVVISDELITFISPKNTTIRNIDAPWFRYMLNVTLKSWRMEPWDHASEPAMTMHGNAITWRSRIPQLRPQMT